MPLRFKKVSLNQAISDLTALLGQKLSQLNQVVWLIPGGSNIPISIEVMNNLSSAQSSHLVIGLTDERLGRVGHPDSNWQQLINRGFDPKKATVLPVLTGKTTDEEVNDYANLLKTALNRSDFCIGQFGIGEDGHIAGILPTSPAITASELVFAYETEQYQRLTLTFPAIRLLDSAYAFAYGPNKQAALDRVKADQESLALLPAKILRELDEAYVYNDQIGE